jgi:alpha-glucoside transport system permease protein
MSEVNVLTRSKAKGRIKDRPPQRVAGQVFVNTLLVILVVVWSIPTVGLLITSFRQEDAINDSGWWTAFNDVDDFTLENYKQVLLGRTYTYETAEGETVTLEGENLKQSFLNSISVTIPGVTIPILIAAFGAYGFAWLRFPGRKLFFTIIVGLLAVPLQISLIPVLRDYKAIGLNGTFLGIWLAHTGFGLPLATYLMFNYISTIPRSIIESALIDGATHFKIFLRLILPLSVPALASFGIFQFMWVWNDLLVALVFLSGGGTERMVITQKLLSLVGNRGQDWHLLTSGAFVSMVLPLIIFFSMQRFFVRGLMAGSVKQ